MTTIQVAIGGAIGSFLMGFFVVAFIQRGGEMLNPFFVTGLLGGFTTFSAFSLEAVNLFEQGAVSQSIAYIVMSVVFSIIGLIFGSMLARVIWL